MQFNIDEYLEQRKEAAPQETETKEAHAEAAQIAALPAQSFEKVLKSQSLSLYSYNKNSGSFFHALPSWAACWLKFRGNISLAAAKSDGLPKL